ATFTLTVKVDADKADGSTLSNTASGATTTTDTDATNDSDTEETSVIARADLTVAKTAPSTTIAGAAAGFDYGLTVTNGGPSVHTGSLTVSDTLPAGTTFSATGSSTDCGAVGQLVTCTRTVTLGVGATTSFTIHVSVAANVADGTDLLNTGHVSSGGTAEGDTTNNDSNTTHTTVQARADLTIGKTAPATAIAGDPNGFDYSLTVTNGGPSVHTGGLTVSDTLPASTVFQASGSDLDCTAVAQAVTCSRSLTLAVGATTGFTIHVTVPAATADGTHLLNTGHVASGGTAE